MPPGSPPALTRLADRSDVVVLKRCVDVPDLLATAAAGQADVAVVAIDAPGLDRAAVDHLRGHGVRPVAVLPGGADLDPAALRATRIGVRALVGDHELDALADLVAAGEEPDRHGRPRRRPTTPAPARSPGRVVAVWGPSGAPGRTTLAVGIAAELARDRRTILVDADPWGGSVAQQLGIVDEVSGLLAATRLVATGQLPERFGGLQRSLDHRLSVVTGLPRADRWVEVRAGVVDHLLDVARSHGHVVVDTGFSLEHDPATDGGRAGRNTMTLESLEAADEVVVVGSADPVGLARLARGLVELRRGDRPLRRARGRQPDAADARLVRAGDRRDARWPDPDHRAALPARRPRRGRPGPGGRPVPGRGRRLRGGPGARRASRRRWPRLRRRRAGRARRR